MTTFLLQTENYEINNEEVLKAKFLIDKYKLTFGTFSPYDYKLCNIDNLKNITDTHKFIPIGNLQYVNEYLNLINKQTNDNLKIPNIQIPKSLCNKFFLGRDYAKIILENKNITSCEGTKNYKKLPKNAFIKENKIKGFTYLGSLDNINLNDGNYILSDYINIIAEYRVFVYDKIIGIQFYDGDCTVFPCVDKINTMVSTLKLEKEYNICDHKSYCLDVAVIEDNFKIFNGKEYKNSYNTVIIEMSPFVSVGTYGFSDNRLLEMYRKGFEWCLEN